MPGDSVTVDHFLGDAVASELLSDLLRHEAAFAAATVGSGARERVDPTQRLVGHADVDSPALAAFERALAAAVPRLMAQLGLPPVPQPELELDVLSYRDQGFYRRHVDVALGAADALSQRILSAVYYLHRRPRPFTGGALRLFSIPGGEAVDVEPEFDRLVAFPAFIPHEVMPVSVPSRAFADGRFTVSAWVRRAAPAR